MDFKYYVDQYGIPAELTGNTPIHRTISTHPFDTPSQRIPSRSIQDLS